MSIAPSMRGFGPKMNRQVGGEVQKSGKSLGQSFGKAFGAVAAIGIGAKVGGFLKDSVSAAGDLEQSVGAIDTVFKRSAGQMHRWGKNAAQSVGLTRNEFNELGTLIGSQLKNGGTAMDKLAPKTNKLITLGADLSSMFGGTTREAVEALSSALKGERDPIERYGVTLNQSKIDAEAAALGYKKVGNAFDNQAQQAATLSLIYKQTADAQGNFAKESNTLSGQQQRLSAQWGDMKARLGTALLPMVTRVVKFLNTNMGPAIGKIRDGFVGLFKLIAKGDFSAELRRAFGWAEDSPIVGKILAIRNAFADKLVPIIKKVTGFLREHPEVIKGAVIALGTLAVAIGVVSIAMGILSLATSPITAVILLVAALGAGIAYLWKNSQTFRDIVTKVGQVLVQLGGWIKTNVIPAIVDLGQKVATNLRPIWDALVEFFRGTVMPLLGQVAQKFREWWPTIQRVGIVVAGLIAKWVEFYTAVQGKVMPIVLKVAGFLLRILVPAVLGGIGVIVKIVGKVIAFGNAMVNAGQKVADFATKVKKKIDQVLTWIGNLPAKAKEKLGDLSGILFDSGKALIQGFIDGIEKMTDPLTGAVSSVVGKINDFVPHSPVKKGPLRKWNGGKPGKALMAMLAGGIRDGAPKVLQAVEKVSAGIDRALKGKKLSKRAAAQMRLVVSAVSREAAKLGQIVTARNDMASSISSGLKGEFDLSAITAPNEFGLSQGPAAAVKAAQGIAARIKAFAAKLAGLLKAGLPTALVQEIAGYGSVEGTRVADVFLKASKTQMASIRSSYAGVQKYANAAGAVVANATYGSKITAQQKSLEDALERGLAKLGIKVTVGIDKRTQTAIYKNGKFLAEVRA